MFMTAASTAAPLRAESYDQFKDWCQGEATDDQRIAACDAVIAANREGTEGLAIAYYKRGNGYSNKGENERAIEDYARAIQLMPDYVAALNNRALAYEDLQQHDRAFADY